MIKCTDIHQLIGSQNKGDYPLPHVLDLSQKLLHIIISDFFRRKNEFLQRDSLRTVFSEDGSVN